MAVAFVNNNHNQHDVANTITLTMGTVGSGNLLVGFVFWDDITNTISTIDDGALGNTYTKIGSPTTGGNCSSQLFYAKNTIGGSCTITVTFGGSVNAIRIVGHEVSGCDTSAPLDKSQITFNNFIGTGTDVISSGSVTTTTDGQYIFGATRPSFGSDVTAADSNGFTLTDSGISQAAGEYKVQPSAGAIAARWTPADNDGYHAAIATFIAAGGASPPGVGTMVLSGAAGRNDRGIFTRTTIKGQN